MLAIPLGKLACIIEKAREFDAESAPVNENRRADGDDEEVIEILDEIRSDPTYQKFVGAVNSLNDDERDEIVALTWLGRGDFSKDEWRGAKPRHMNATTAGRPRISQARRCSRTISRRRSLSSSVLFVLAWIRFRRAIATA